MGCSRRKLSVINLTSSVKHAYALLLLGVVHLGSFISEGGSNAEEPSTSKSVHTEGFRLSDTAEILNLDHVVSRLCPVDTLQRCHRERRSNCGRNSAVLTLRLTSGFRVTCALEGRYTASVSMDQLWVMAKLMDHTSATHLCSASRTDLRDRGQ